MTIDKINMRDSYKFYKANSEVPLDIKTYMHIITGFLYFLICKVIDGFQVQLAGGNSLGTIAVVGKKPKVFYDDNGNVRGLAVDWKATNEYWANNAEAKEKKERLYHLNEHTNGIRYNFVWWKTDMKIANKYLYSFTLCKPAKRALVKRIREGKEYLVHT